MTNSINMYMLGNTRAVPREAYRGLKISRVPTKSQGHELTLPVFNCRRKRGEAI